MFLTRNWEKIIKWKTKKTRNHEFVENAKFMIKHKKKLLKSLKNIFLWKKTSDEKVEIIIVNYSDEDNKENTEKTSCKINELSFYFVILLLLIVFL